MAIDVRLTSTFDPKGLNQAVKDINSIKSQLGSIEKRAKIASDNFNAFGGTLKKLGAVAAATFSAREIGQFFAESIKGAVQDEKSLRVLNKTLENMGFAGASQQVDKFVSKLQFSAGIADDELRPALNNLIISTGNLSKSQQMLNVALDVSAGTGKDLDTITVALAKAYNGNYTALKKLNLGIDETLIKNQDLSGILTVLSQKFAGASANSVDTYAGKLAVLKLGVDDAKEAIGYGLLKALEDVGSALGYTSAGGVAGAVSNFGQNLGKAIEGLGKYTAELIRLSKNSKEAQTSGQYFAGLFTAITKEILVASFQLDKFSWLFDKLIQKSEEFAPATATPAQSRLLAQARERQRIIEEQIRATEAAKKAQEELRKNMESLMGTARQFADFVAGTSPKSIQGALGNADMAMADLQKLMKGHPKINEALVKSFQTLSGTIQTNLGYALDQARTKLEEARQQYAQFKNGIKSSITSIVDFSNQTEGLSFVANLQQQAEKAKNFGGQLAKLLQMGLSQTAIQQIASSGYEVGSVIAQEIINGGSTVVNMVNQLVSSVDQVAEQVSTSMAQQFYGAGVDAAQSLVDGLIQRLNESAAIIAQAIANATAGNTTTNPDAGKKKKPKKSTPPPSKPKYLPPMIPGRAIGGPVTAGFPYLVGERGPEIFMPSTQGTIIPNNRIGNGSSINITVNAGMGTNGALVGKQIVEAIKKYEKTSGQVFAGA